MPDARFFFTDIVPRAAVKVSRDALGLIPIWSRTGLRLVGKLTTGGGSPRRFTTMLLAHSFAPSRSRSGQCARRGPPCQA